MNKLNLRPYLVFFLFLSLFFASSCSQQESNQVESKRVFTSLSIELEEILPGYVEGYLSKKELPNSIALVPPPPAEGSVAEQLDLEIANQYIALTDEARKEQAAIDAILTFPEATLSFNPVLPIEISDSVTPVLYILMRRSLADAGVSTSAAKHHYNRARPFMVNDQPTCSPEDEEYLRKDGSYPSGHTAIGWAWALILTEVFPDHADAILERGKQYGISRNVCNVHWHSDVLAGRLMGAATVARLHANEQFEIDLAAAKEEVSFLLLSN